MRRVSFKVCGIGSVEAAREAVQAGARWLGFIFYEKSPRFVSEAQWREMAPALPDASRVAVLVDPEPAEISAKLEAGFSFAQVHFPAETPLASVSSWSIAATPSRLWLAPRRLEGQGFDERWLPLADAFLWDASRKGAFGGTGRLSDWEGFARARDAWPDRGWMLAGGLTPENLLEALRATGADRFDINSGVESAPGVKDPLKLQAVKRALKT